MIVDLFAGAAPSGDINLINRRIRLCSKCSHQKDVCLHPVGGWGETSNCKVAVVGQYPGKGEDVLGRIMSKEAGEFIRNHFYRLGLADNEIYWANAVSCPPPDDEPNITKEQLHNCGSFLDETLDAVKPKLIVGLGNNAKTRMFYPKHMAAQKKEAKSLLLTKFRLWDYRGFPLVIVGNPSSLRRKIGYERELFQEDVDKDFEYLQKVLTDLDLR